jgi:protease IV
MYKGIVLLAAGLIVLAGGCGGANTGYIVKPVSLNEKMQENVVASDGVFVGDRIAVVEVSGLIMNARETGLLSSGENPVAAFIEKIDQAQADSRVKALVLRINSPGGGVTASDIMYKKVQDFKAARKVPVVAVIEDVGASGGFYIACSADTIMAHPTSITGSIGVIVEMFSLDGTLKKIGISSKAIKSGKYKDMGSPFKELNEQDEAVMQNLVNEYYERFLKVVCAGRPKMAAEKVKELADGRVYSGQQACANGLVDSVGYVEDAITTAKKLSGISQAKVVMYARPAGQKQNIYSQSDVPAQMNLINVNVPGLMTLSQPQFLFLWTGK